MSQYSVYLILEFVTALLFALVFTVSALYQVTFVELTPLQLVLVGTTLEATIFLFEVPTGALADVKSRRLSVIIGYGLIGLGFIVEGALPFFSTVLLAQVLWGLGYTFTSGATQAWIADEIGQERAGEAFLRGSQVGWMGALTAIPISVSLGIVDIRLPIVLGGVLNVLFSGFLVVAMREESFKPKPPEDRTTLSLLLKTVRDTRQLVRRQPTLLALLAIGLFFGLYSEGFDRLWTPHLLESFSQAWTALVNPVIWIGVIEAVALVAGIVATEFTRRRVDTHHAVSIARGLILFAAIIVVALAGFGLAKNFWIAVVLYWLIGMARNATSPLQATWLNLRIDDSRVRATVFSVTSQIDAVGQISGGPLVGAIGNHSIRAALIASSLLLAPVIPLYALAARHGEREASDVG